MTGTRQCTALVLLLWFAFVFNSGDGITCKRCLHEQVVFNKNPTDAFLRKHAGNAVINANPACKTGKGVPTEECPYSKVCTFIYIQQDIAGYPDETEFIRRQHYRRECTTPADWYNGPGLECNKMGDMNVIDPQLHGSDRNKMMYCQCNTTECNIGSRQEVCPPIGFC